MKKSSPIKELENCKNGITDSILKWTELNTYGGSDPCWNDGYNMNLVRNHILYYRKKIEQLCETLDCALPTEYYLPIPPVVPDSYMANKGQKERICKLRSYHRAITFSKAVYDDTQLHF
ncbi:hypothetical protein LI221_16345 [Faecalimonas umbilicata]|nr:hypothetical protein [Faecalimonas umbilicata]